MLSDQSFPETNIQSLLTDKLSDSSCYHQNVHTRHLVESEAVANRNVRSEWSVREMVGRCVDFLVHSADA